MEAPDPGLLEEAVDLMTREGAAYAEARYHRVGGARILVVNGAVMAAGIQEQEGVALRAVVDGGLGFASSTGASREALVDAARRAVAAARAAAARRKRPISLSPARLGRARYSVAEREPLADKPMEDKVAALLEAYKSIRPVRDVKLAAVSLGYLELSEEKIVVTSDGGYVESRIPRVMVGYNITAVHGGRSANRWAEHGGSGGFEVFKSLSVEEKISDDAESLRVALVEAGSPPSGVMDVVLSPEVVGLAVHESAGHPSEADRILGREAAQAGLSFRSSYEGDVIGSEEVTVVDDPTIPGSAGFYLYDDEAVAARPRRLYDRGRLGELLHNRETAAVYGVESNGAARAMDYESEPIVRMSNTYMEPGTYSFEELIEDVKQGVYIKKYMEWNIDDVRWSQRYVGLEAYLIENGELTKPVTNVALELTTRQLYSSIDAVGRDLQFFMGLCGKGEPPQSVPVWMGGPHVRLREVRLG